MENKTFVTNDDGRKFELVDTKTYVQELQKNSAETVKAEKFGAIIAKQVTEETPVKVNANGHENDEIAHPGEWVVTHADLDTGKPVLDKNGETNSWVIKDDVIHKKYDMENISEDGFVKPKGGMQTFIKTDKDIAILPPWEPEGSTNYQHLKAGSYINITNPNDMYGIEPEKFKETYAIRGAENSGQTKSAEAAVKTAKFAATNIAPSEPTNNEQKTLGS